ncbi:MAG: TlpA family protein disulfide reductase, partial [Burkholderiales bacterium]
MTADPIRPIRMKHVLLAFALATALVPAARAQTPPQPVVEGRTIEGQPFKLAALKGKVVLVMFWSTGCAVCRDKMPELR